MKTISTLKLLPTAAAAVFLIATPVAAQGGGTAPEPFAGPTMTDEQCRALQQDYWACPGEQGTLTDVEFGVGTAIGDNVALREVPESVVATTPAMQGQLYFALPDDRIAIVDRNSRQIVDVIVLE